MAPTYLALYEVDHPDVLSSAPYMKVVKHEASLGSDSFEARTRAQPHISRGIFRQIFPPSDAYTVPDQAEWLVAVGHGDLPDSLHKAYDAWYNTARFRRLPVAHPVRSGRMSRITWLYMM